MLHRNKNKIAASGLLTCGVGVIALLTLAATSGQIAAVAGENTVRQEDQRPRNHYVWQADLHSFFSMAFEQAGYEPQSAVDLASLALRTMNLYDGNSPRYRETNWDSADPYPLLLEAFQKIGWKGAEAEAATVTSLIALGVPGWLPKQSRVTREGETLCQAYRVRIIWCEGEARKEKVTYIHRNSWTTLTGACGAAPCSAGEITWYTLTMTGNCVPGIPNGACVWVAVISGVLDVDCDRVLLGLNCFQETNPTVDCQEIELVCGPADDGPDGVDEQCPDCG